MYQIVRTIINGCLLKLGCMHMTSISHPILHRKCSQECKERYARNDRPQSTFHRLTKHDNNHYYNNYYYYYA